ncbi:hypothetical protein SESBI_48684 [Sesbania bispinosa]|nr:hypothetical protein SESBI_48684 [Sesbania bispinosa]
MFVRAPVAINVPSGHRRREGSPLLLPASATGATESGHACHIFAARTRSISQSSFTPDSPRQSAAVAAVGRRTKMYPRREVKWETENKRDEM